MKTLASSIVCLSMAGLLSVTAPVAMAATTTYLIDTGGGAFNVYNGTPYEIEAGSSYDFGTADEYLSLSVPFLGLEAGSVSFGDGYTFAFTDAVSSYNIGQNLSQSFILFNNHGSANPIGFSLSGLSAGDIVSIEFVSSQNQAVTMSIGAQSVIAGDTVIGTSPNFTGNWVGISELTGLATYAGSFSVAGGEGSVAALRITIETSTVPEPSSFAALAGLGALGFVASRRRRAAL